jgi:hypothetical protein
MISAHTDSDFFGIGNPKVSQLFGLVVLAICQLETLMSLQALKPAIAFILFTWFCISINDILIKHLSDYYPLHEMVFVRSVIGIVFSLILVQLEGAGVF